MSRDGRVSGIPSENLLKKLRQFRFQKQSGPKLDVDVKEEGKGNENKDVEETNVEPNSEDHNTVESTAEDDCKRPVLHDVLELNKKANDLEVTSDEESKLSEQENDIMAKENSLTFLMSAFPKKDKMILQDVLRSSNWNVEVAMEQLCPEKSSGPEKRRIDSSPENSPPHKKVRRKDMDDIEEEKADDDDDANVDDTKVFDSDDSDQEISDELTGDKQKVLEFLSTASVGELRAMPSCSQKKADAIIEQRPFLGWRDLVVKFQSGKFLGTDLLNSAQSVLHMRQDVDTLMKKCMKLATQMEQAVIAGASSVKMQPSLLSQVLTLASYQMVGLNWLVVMHKQQLNGILADEMGLGKTVQVIAFLAHLKEMDASEEGLLHLVIVPSSTLDNWKNEFQRWCPSLLVTTYYGSPDERKATRVSWIRDGIDDIDVILTTYNTVNSSPEERKMFRVLPLEYVILDEAHMLKNMTTQRYENLSRINARHRILLTGTPLQNNLLELMSLLIFVMPNMFAGKKEHLKALFSKYPKQVVRTINEDKFSKFEQEQVAQARRIMKPFVLRRLKTEVLEDLPTKTDETILCALIESQQEQYNDLIQTFSQSAGQINSDISGMAMVMELRKMANHPLLLRNFYTDDQLEEMAGLLAADPFYKQDNKEYIFDDLAILSDFQINHLAQTYASLSGYLLPPSLFLESGKLRKLDEIMPELKKNNHRVLIFSQFVVMLDVLEVYLKKRDHQYIRLDGSTPVTLRQELINLYNKDESIFVFLLSTRAGGMGINLTSADTVIIHDIDFNPYNDKQAEDRCHRIGQSRSVRVMRLISAKTIEEGIYQVAQEKLSLEKEINNAEDNDSTEEKNVVCLLKQALGLDSTRAANLLVSEQDTS